MLNRSRLSHMFGVNARTSRDRSVKILTIWRNVFDMHQDIEQMTCGWLRVIQFLMWKKSRSCGCPNYAVKQVPFSHVFGVSVIILGSRE